VDAGNIYVNQRVTGAIVGRQPFGGRKASGFGPGAKAGGPNYVSQFCRIGKRRRPVQAGALSRGPRASVASDQGASVPGEPLGSLLEIAQTLRASEQTRLLDRARNYHALHALEFAPVHSMAEVLGQHNAFRYQGAKVLLFVAPSADPVDALSAHLAASLAGSSVLVVLEGQRSGAPWLQKLARLPGNTNPEAALEALQAARVERVRSVGLLPERFSRCARVLGIHVVSEPVHDDGYVELRHYLKEQSISVTFHRHGNLRLGGTR
jgi:RHH-type proline utilization regulon transcriptional repressor/proline dehydrogenase/delta 1-pyrroline-5-carboxylate dehydrogenase